MTNFEKVKEFHKVFGLRINDQPCLVDHKLRSNLITEEYLELMDELTSDHVSLQNIAKEMADLLYVVYGSAVTFGIDLDRVFKEVHASNMSKLDDSGKPLIREDGKILKSHNYKLPDLEWM